MLVEDSCKDRWPKWYTGVANRALSILIVFVLISPQMALGVGDSLAMGETTKHTGQGSEIEKKAEALLRLSPSFVKLSLREQGTGRQVYLVIQHSDLADYLAYKAGLPMDGRGRFKDRAAYKEFIAIEYSRFLSSATKDLVDLNLNDLAKFLSMTRFGDIEAAKQYVQSYSFTQPMTLADFGVGSREELLQKYFKPIPSSPCLTIRPDVKFEGDLPVLIGLLIDQGYRVIQGDIVPVLSVCPPDA